MKEEEEEGKDTPRVVFGLTRANYSKSEDTVNDFMYRLKNVDKKSFPNLFFVTMMQVLPHVDIKKSLIYIIINNTIDFNFKLYTFTVT